MRRGRRTVGIAAALLVSGAEAGAQQEITDAQLLLEYSEAMGVLEGFQPGVEGFLAELGVVFTPELEAVLDAELSVDALYPIMREEFVSQGDAEAFAAAAELVRDGAIGRVHALVDTIEVTMPLEEFAAVIEGDPPSESRLQMVGRIAQSQAAGEFYLLLAESHREAATIIAATLLPEPPSFEPMPQAQHDELNQRYLIGAFYSFLQRYEPVPEAELQAVLEEWQSDAGRWYVRAYSLAMAATALEAARRVASKIGAP